MLLLHQVHALLIAERSRDVAGITAAVTDVMAQAETDLLQIDQVFRDAGSPVYLIADGPGRFQVITDGLPGWKAALQRAGLSPDANRAGLALAYRRSA